MKISVKVLLGVALIGLLTAIGSSPVFALPSFARQTGMACAACHTVFPELTTYGRTFKLNGYTTNNSDSLKDGSDETGYRLNISNTPPIAAMIQIADTITKTPPLSSAPGTVANGTDHNGQLEFPSQFSLFYAGALSPKLGAFVQLTYDSASGALAFDNTDIRLADRFQIANTDLVLGLTLNNNPTVQDVFNSTPAWGFPYSGGNTALTPATSTKIEMGAGTVGGLGLYAFWNQLLYAEFSLYRTAPQGAPAAYDIQGYAPYWRVALTKDFDKHSFEVGAYGMNINSFPDAVAINSPLDPQDNFNDFAIDAQYQYVGKEHQVTLKGTAIWETQNLAYSSIFANPALQPVPPAPPSLLLTNASNTLTSYKIDLTYYYDRKIGASIGYFNIGGTMDPTVYASTGFNVPDSNGMVFEINYVPWYNTKFQVQYTYYNKFDGYSDINDSAAGRYATDNNTLMVMAWLMI